MTETKLTKEQAKKYNKTVLGFMALGVVSCFTVFGMCGGLPWQMKSEFSKKLQQQKQDMLNASTMEIDTFYMINKGDTLRMQVDTSYKIPAEKFDY